MGLFDVDPAVWAEYREKIQADARTRVPDEVVIAAPFRHGGAGAKMGVSKVQGGALAYGAISLFNKKKAGGLPQRTMLVVTPTKVLAFKWKLKGRAMPITGDELASWDRDSLQVSTERKQGLTMLTITAPDGTYTLAPSGIKDDPITQELIAELQGTK